MTAVQSIISIKSCKLCRRLTDETERESVRPWIPKEEHGTCLATKLVWRPSGSRSESVPPTICFTCPSWRSMHGLKRLRRRGEGMEQRGEIRVVYISVRFGETTRSNPIAHPIVLIAKQLNNSQATHIQSKKYSWLFKEKWFDPCKWYDFRYMYKLGSTVYENITTAPHSSSFNTWVTPQ